MLKKCFIIFLLITLTNSCLSINKKSIKYQDFQNIINTSSSLFPLPNGKESLIIATLPNDKYPKIYSLNHENKKFYLKIDAKKSIKHLMRDYTKKHYFFYLDNYGDENYQIYTFNTKTYKYSKLFGNKGFRATIMDFSNSGKFLYIRSNHENKNIYRVYKLDLISKNIEAISPPNIHFDGGKVDYNDKQIALFQAHGNNEINLYLLDIKNKKLNKILDKKNTMYIPSFFHPNENSLYINTDHKQDRVACAKIYLKKPKNIQWVYKSNDKDLECYYGRLRKLSYIYETQNGKLGIKIFEGIYNKELKFPFPKNSMIQQFSVVPFSNTGIVRIMSSQSPGDYYSFDLSKGMNAKFTKISNLNQSRFKDSDLANSYDLFYKSYDGLKIHGIIYAKEKWLNNKTKYPVIVWPHGGPDSSEFHIFNPIFQYWVLNGFVVFAPNYRGSMGYGKKFETLNDRDWGGGHIKDIIYGKKELEKLPYIDPTNMFIVGASFGGFSTLSLITQYPKEFKAAVAIVAFANLFNFMKTIPQTSSWLNEFQTEIGDMSKDKDLYYERSPYFHVDKIKTPLKIYQAENDTRTVKEEMDEFVLILKENKIPYEYEILENEGHSISRTESWEKLLSGTVKFLNSYKKEN